MKKITKAILTGGGRATRLRPVTATINKHLLPLANKPMIFHAIEKVVEAGVTDIFINTNPGETELQKYVGNGDHWGVRIIFFEQRGGPQGIAHVVNEAKEFIGDDPFMFYLSDNILLGGVKEMVNEFNQGAYDAMIALSEVENPTQFGVPVFDENHTLVDTLEKPAEPPNNFAITGIYLFGGRLFFEAFDHITKSDRGEYEIPSVFSYLLQHKYKVGHKEITGWWKDTGKPRDLLLANQLLLDALKDDDLWFQGQNVSSVTQIQGNVHIGLGTHLGDQVSITGPVIIGEHCVLENCAIGPYVTIGSNTHIRGATVSHSIILEDGRIDCPIHITQSLIGKGIDLKEKDTTSGAHSMVVGDKTVLEL